MSKAFVGFVVVLGALIFASIGEPIYQIGMAAINGLAVLQ